jgi:hypothetical protein
MRQVLDSIRAHGNKQRPSAEDFSKDIVQGCVSRNKIVHRLMHDETEREISRTKKENKKDIQRPREKILTQDTGSNNGYPFNNNRKNSSQGAYVVPRL